MAGKKRKRYVTVNNAFIAEIVGRADGKFNLKVQQPGLTVNLHLPDCWIGYLAGEFHAHLKHRQAELDRLKKELKGEL